MFSKFVDNLKTVLSVFGDTSISRGFGEENRFFRRATQLSETDISKIYLKSNLIQRIIETIPDLALECEIVINSESKDKIDKEKLNKRFRDWKIKQRFFDATISARIYRESYLVLDINDGANFNQPINWGKCKGLNDIIFVEFNNLSVNWNEQQTERLSYKIRTEKDKEIVIHPERVLLFPGKMLTPKLQSYNNGAHQSAIEPTIESYNAYVQTINESNNLLARLITFIFKMGDLRNYLTSDPVDGIQTVQARLREHKTSIGGVGGICIDKESEEVEWISYSLAGVPEVINKSKELFIANTELTHDQVMNEGSHSTGSDLEDKNTQRKVKSFIRHNWLENLNTVCQIITCEFYPSKIDILFDLNLPEQSLTQLETTTAKYQQAQTDNIYYTMGVLNQETLQESRFASSTPWEITLINPGVFPKPVDPNSNTSDKSNSGNSKSNNDSKSKSKGASSDAKKTDSKFTDTIYTPDVVDYQITKENLESILERVKKKNPLIFAFAEAEEDNKPIESE